MRYGRYTDKPLQACHITSLDGRPQSFYLLSLLASFATPNQTNFSIFVLSKSLFFRKFVCCITVYCTKCRYSDKNAIFLFCTLWYDGLFIHVPCMYTRIQINTSFFLLFCHCRIFLNLIVMYMTVLSTLWSMFGLFSCIITA